MRLKIATFLNLIESIDNHESLYSYRKKKTGYWHFFLIPLSLFGPCKCRKGFEIDGVVISDIKSSEWRKMNYMLHYLFHTIPCKKKNTI